MPGQIDQKFMTLKFLRGKQGIIVLIYGHDVKLPSKYLFDPIDYCSYELQSEKSLGEVNEGMMRVSDFLVVTPKWKIYVIPSVVWKQHRKERENSIK